MKNLLIFIFIIAGLMLAGSAWADILIITNEGVAESTLSKDDIKKIFLGKKSMWGNNTKIHFALTKSTDLHKAFCKQYLKRSPKQFANFWKKMVFTGRGKKPKKFKTTEDLMKYVAETEGAVGYIDTNTVAVNVKTFSVQ